MTVPSAVILVMAIARFVSGGMARRMACGSTTKIRVWVKPKPVERASFPLAFFNRGDARPEDFLGKGRKDQRKNNKKNHKAGQSDANAWQPKEDEQDHDQRWQSAKDVRVDDNEKREWLEPISPEARKQSSNRHSER